MNPLLNSGDYNIEAENACASLLSQFNSQYIFDICRWGLMNREVPSIIEKPNIVNSAEMCFNQMKITYPTDVPNITEVRDTTYIEIIDYLCKNDNFEFIDQGEETHMPLAQLLYYFLVCGYNRCLIGFFTAYIYDNKYDLYESLKIGDLKKSKDTSTIYNKKFFKKDLRLGLIIANIEYVISSICGNDIPFEQIIKYVFPDLSTGSILLNSLRPVDDVFSKYKKTLFGPYHAPIVANIQLSLQGLYNTQQQ